MVIMIVKRAVAFLIAVCVKWLISINISVDAHWDTGNLRMSLGFEACTARLLLLADLKQMVSMRTLEK